MKKFSLREVDRIIEMAWEDRTPFEAIYSQFNINEKKLISIMRNNLRRNSFNLWRKRVTGRKTKHSSLRDNSVDRFKCNLQREWAYYFSEECDQHFFELQEKPRRFFDLKIFFTLPISW